MHTYTLAALFVPSVKEGLASIITAINYIRNNLLYYMVILYSLFIRDKATQSR